MEDETVFDPPVNFEPTIQQPDQAAIHSPDLNSADGCTRIIRTAFPDGPDSLLNLLDTRDWIEDPRKTITQPSHRSPIRYISPTSAQWAYVYIYGDSTESMFEKCAQDLGLLVDASVPGCQYLATGEEHTPLISYVPEEYAVPLPIWIERMSMHFGSEQEAQKLAAELMPIEEIAFNVWIDNWDRQEKNYVVAGTSSSAKEKIYGVDFGFAFGAKNGLPHFASGEDSYYLLPEWLRRLKSLDDPALDAICNRIASTDLNVVEAIVTRPFRHLGINEEMPSMIMDGLTTRQNKVKEKMVQLWES